MSVSSGVSNNLHWDAEDLLISFIASITDLCSRILSGRSLPKKNFHVPWRNEGEAKCLAAWMV